MKRLLGTLLAILMVLATVLPCAVAETTYTVYVAAGGGSLKLRKGPGTDYGVAGYVQHGDKVTLVKLGSTWSQVTVVSTGKTGYIKNKYFDGTTEKQGGGTSSGTTDATIVSSSGKRIRLREEPNTTSTTLAYLPDGTKVETITTSGSWVYIRVPSKDNKVGWVTKANISTGGGGSTPTTTTYGVYQVSGDSVNLRYGAGTSYAVRCALPQGTALKVTGSEGNWYRVTTLNKGYTGYISKNFVESGATGTCTASSLNIRTQPNASADWVGSIPNGKTVTVRNIVGNWAYVTYNKVSGYCSMNYLSFK